MNTVYFFWLLDLINLEKKIYWIKHCHLFLYILYYYPLYNYYVFILNTMSNKFSNFFDFQNKNSKIGDYQDLEHIDGVSISTTSANLYIKLKEMT